MTGVKLLVEKVITCLYNRGALNVGIESKVPSSPPNLVQPQERPQDLCHDCGLDPSENRQTLDALQKLKVCSVIDFALPVYYHSLKVTEKALLEKVQYTAGKLVTGALQLTSKLKLEELGWETIQSRANILGYSIFHKINKGKTRQLVRSCLPARKNCPHTPRFGGFVPFPYHNLKFTNSLSPYFTSKYNKFEKKSKSL